MINCLYLIKEMTTVSYFRETIVWLIYFWKKVLSHIVYDHIYNKSTWYKRKRFADYSWSDKIWQFFRHVALNVRHFSCFCWGVQLDRQECSCMKIRVGKSLKCVGRKLLIIAGKMYHRNVVCNVWYDNSCITLLYWQGIS